MLSTSRDGRFSEVREVDWGGLGACRAQLRTVLLSDPEGVELLPMLERGKMIRPLLCMVAGELVGSTGVDVLDGAVAIELCHGASLIHDDIIDEAEVRRGLPAVHTRLGKDRALVLGDYLILKAVGVLAAAAGRIPAERVLAAATLLSRHGVATCAGQYRELAVPAHGTDVEEIVGIIRGKTSALLVCALQVGVILGAGVHHAAMRPLEEYGWALGLAYQAEDDLLDLIGSESEMGKPTGNSFGQRRPMLPLEYVRESASPATMEILARLETEGRADPAELRHLLESTGALKRVRDFQFAQIARAEDALQLLPAVPAREFLRSVLYHSVKRKG